MLFSGTLAARFWRKQPEGCLRDFVPERCLHWELWGSSHAHAAPKPQELARSGEQ